MFPDIAVELGRRVKLGIAADHLLLPLGDIGEVDEVADHLAQPVWSNSPAIMVWRALIPSWSMVSRR
jgi:hypothetical protein